MTGRGARAARETRGPRDVALFLPDAIGRVVRDAEMFGPDGAAPAYYEPGAEGSRLVVVTGSNASGKSLLVRFLGSRLAEFFADDARGFERILIGMAARTKGGFMRAVVFGSEDDESTGQISIHAVQGLIKNGPGRERVHLAALDEPDLGLSEDFADALGDRIASYAAGLPDLCAALAVVSHSRALVSRLMPLGPHCFRMGDPTPTADWIARGVEPRSQADLDALADASIARYRAIHRVQESRKSPGGAV